MFNSAVFLIFYDVGVPFSVKSIGHLWRLKLISDYRFARQGDLDGALRRYDACRELAPGDTALHQKLEATVLNYMGGVYRNGEILHCCCQFPHLSNVCGRQVSAVSVPPSLFL